MMIERITEALIYETPDGGKTVYVRKSGEVHRKLHSESQEKKDLIRMLEEDKLWGEIRRAARDNPMLQGILDQAVLVYKLIDTK